MSIIAMTSQCMKSVGADVVEKSDFILSHHNYVANLSSGPS